MLAADEMVASLVEELEADGQLDNTFIFFTSDNGWFQGEHRIPFTKNRPYEESVRVPLFVRGPGVTAGMETEKLALSTDLAPTFADLAGASFPADGRSPKPLLRSEEPGSWRSSVLLEKLPQEGGDEEGNAKGKAKAKGEEGETGAGGAQVRSVRTGNHKYVEYGNGDVEHYDLETDPYELESLHERADRSLLEDLKAKQDTLKSCSEEGCREAKDVT